MSRGVMLATCLAVIFSFSAGKEAAASNVQKYKNSLGDRTYRFGLRGHLPMIAYLAPNSALYFAGAASRNRVGKGAWRIVESKGKVGICITAGKFKNRPITKCYPARRFRSFLKDWKGNPLGLRAGRRLQMGPVFRPSYSGVKRALR